MGSAGRLIAALVVLTACTSPPREQTNPEVRQDLSPSAVIGTLTTSQPLVSTASASTPAPAIERTRYTIQGVFEYPAKQLGIVQEVTFLNDTGQSLNTLELVVDANRFPGAFILDSVTHPDGRPISGWSLEGIKLRIPLANSLDPGAQWAFVLDFTLRIPAGAGVLGFNDRQANLGNWLPSVPPYRSGQGWLIYPANPVGEHLSYDLADYYLTLQVLNYPTGLTVISNVSLDVHEGLIDLEATARNLSLTFSPELIPFSGGSEEVGVFVYTFAGGEAGGFAAVPVVTQALALFSGLFGAYPHESFSLVAADFPDGMEFDGLAFLNQGYFESFDGTPQNYLTLLAVHETAHQWWPGLVGSDQAIEPWLDEALATYCELIFLEHFYPNLTEWWWDFRVDAYEPFTGFEGHVDDMIYQHSRFRPYVNAVYLNGVRFLEAVRAAIGDEAFFQALSDYTQKFKGREATSSDLLELFSRTEPNALTQILETFFER